MSELAKTRIVTEDGIVTVTKLSTVGPDRMCLYLMKAAWAAQMTRSTDNTEIISREIKDLIIYPFTSS